MNSRLQAAAGLEHSSFSDLIVLQSGSWRANITPRIGGGLSALQFDSFDIFRPADSTRRQPVDREFLDTGVLTYSQAI